ncbi:MAG: PIN/TRAM domain-containing protein [Bacillaceae bacterium]|nr:PIN/TRAM domain-containing protein [Bacillaceae bacterium]
MLNRLVHLLFIFIGGTLGYLLIPEISNVLREIPLWLINPYVGTAFGVIIFYYTTFGLTHYIVNLMKLMEESIIKAPVTDVIFGTMGLILGLIVAYLIGIPISAIQIPVVSTISPIFVTIFIGYLGYQIGFKKRHELNNLFSLTRHFSKDKKKAEEGAHKKNRIEMKILDTSVIIDGRIADICEAGFIEGTLVIPDFVLGELQHIADSSDKLKRIRGQRGLDILNKIRNNLHANVEIEIYEGKFPDIQEVDSKLVKLAKVLPGVVITNDFNLNKVCELQGIKVLNINDLANAMKPIVLPGEKLKVQIIKHGKEYHQGIAYLNDGTMIVVDDGQEHIGQNVIVVVSKALQTSTGRLIFAKPICS